MSWYVHVAAIGCASLGGVRAFTIPAAGRAERTAEASAGTLPAADGETRSWTADRPEYVQPEAAAGSACSPLVVGVALGLAAAVGMMPASAANIENGQNIFEANCAACHSGGNNAVQPDKKLKKEALTQFGMYDVDKIKYQVTNGKNAMPAFGERLLPGDIEDVANYVLQQADKGWPAPGP
eukprot:TRINITY_DN12932_c0_g1_i1.p1 TRINITY_DN12932_c0_g1~~TRINITY_DN12932_c0_g1_i1.p1  ORF type:complete len:201 (+),score=33.24 TRINITY_DN12932_c0_g1_i1:63-605(+)